MINDIKAIYLTGSFLIACMKVRYSPNHYLLLVILTWCEPSNPLKIYEHNKEAENFLHQHHTRLGNVDLDYNDDILNLALTDWGEPRYSFFHYRTALFCMYVCMYIELMSGA